MHFFESYELFNFLLKLSKIQSKGLLTKSFIEKVNQIWRGHNFSFEERLDFLKEDEFSKNEEILSVQVTTESGFYGQVICRNLKKNSLENEELFLDLVEFLAIFLEKIELSFALSSEKNVQAYVLKQDENNKAKEKLTQAIEQKTRKLLAKIEQAKHYEFLHDNSADLIFRVDGSYKILYHNKAFRNLIIQNSCIGKSVFSLELFIKDQKFWEDSFEQVLKQGLSFKSSKIIKIGSKSVQCNCCFIPECKENNKEYIHSILIFIQGNKNFVELLLKLEEKELLLKELHHRIQNNLMIISSFLSLQFNSSKELLLKSELKQAMNRIESVALVHYQLHKASSLSKLDLKDYINDLTENIINSYSNENVTLKVELDSLMIPLDLAVSLGICLNEAITNAFKHVFCPKKGCSLQIKLKNKKKSFTLTIEDDGPGFPDDLVCHEDLESLGLQLLYSISKQMNAKIKLSSKNGAKLKIEVPHSF